MSLKKDQYGFHAVHLVLVVFVFAVIGVVALKVSSAQRQMSRGSSDQAATVPAASVAKSDNAVDVPSAPVIKSASDLKKSQDVLDKVDPGESDKDASSLSAELDGF